MARVTVYLFETKSIQSYLSRTGKLKDMVIISDMLVDLIDTGEYSWVRKVLDKCKIANNLSYIDDNTTYDFNDLAHRGICFFRCKGGSFYCMSYDQNLVLSFRSAWTLLFQQAFPGMDFTDSCTQVDDQKFVSELDNAFSALASSFNAPSISLPYATPVCQSTSITGKVAVFNGSQSRNFDLAQSRFGGDDENSVSSLSNEILYKKFLGIDNVTKYRIAFNQYLRGNDNDIALVHLDGNGIGQKLLKLRKDSRNCTMKEYVEKMTSFSQQLGKATKAAVNTALNTIIEKSTGGETLIFRPLILGGDDITLLIEPRYAFDFCVEVSNNFQINSSKFLKNKKYSGGYLTMSGAVLFNKINHPYNNSSVIVESLAEMAKKLTKKHLNGTEKKAGPAAIAFFRMSATSQENISEVIRRSREYSVFDHKINHNVIFNSGPACYYVKSADSLPPNSEPTLLCTLLNFVYKLSDSFCSRLHGRLRRIMTAISHGDLQEARDIYKRMLDIIDDKEKEVLNNIFPHECFYKDVSTSELKKYECVIDDILVLIHYIRSKKNKGDQNL